MPTPNFTLRNYNLCLDQMLELNLPVTTFAETMGEALAIIHWGANVDAYDIEFVLGRERAEFESDNSIALHLDTEDVHFMLPHTGIDSLRRAFVNRRITRMWVLDFNLCNIWEEESAWEKPDTLISRLVQASSENDPYYPLPLMDLEIDRKL